jgi:hypothetical protein
MSEEGASDEFGRGIESVEEREQMDVDEVGDECGGKGERAAA